MLALAIPYLPACLFRRWPARPPPLLAHPCPAGRYTGKALHGLVTEMRAAPEQWVGRKVLFVHTGGLLGLYDKAAELQPLVEAQGRAHRLALD